MTRYITLLFILLSILGCKEAPQQTIERSPQRVYRYPLRYEIKTIDPAYTQDIPALIVIPQIFDGLVQYDKDLNIIPSIAERWSISNDGLVYTFYIRKGVRFHNGREVKAGDLIYSLKRLVRLKDRPLPKVIIEKVTGAKELVA